MKKHCFILCFLFIVLNTFSQSTNDAFKYRVNLNELKMKTYEKDSTANALVLYEYGNSFVSKSEYDLRTEEKHKIKILNREGFDNANIVIHLYKSGNREETVKNIIATTYNLIDGEVIKTNLQKKDIFKEKYDENHTLIKFTLPNIKEGSVITYSYTTVSPFMFNYHGWNFQSDIPKLYSEYNASIPANWEYNIKLVGGKKLFINDSKIEKDCLEGRAGSRADCSNSIYAMKDVPAFIEEDYMTSKSNYLARIEYELKTFKSFDGRTNDYTKTWKTVDAEFKTDKDIGRQLNKSIKLEDHVSTNIINETNALKKAKAIYKHVQKKYTWNGEYKIFANVSIKDLIKNKSGNISSINILLHNLLNEANIDAKAVLISTRNNGFPTKIFPVISEFNYLIIQVSIDGKAYLLDATDRYLSFGEIPFRCLNSYGRLMDFKAGSKWIDIAPKELSTMQHRVLLNMNENATITGSINSKTTGYHSLYTRKKYYQNKDAYITDLENKHQNLEIFDYEVTKGEETNSEFIEAYNIEYNSDETGDLIYLNPFFITIFTENPFKLQERTYPIDFGYKDTFYYTLRLNLGEGYSILEKPKGLNLALPNKKGSVLFSTTIQGSFVNMLFKISFKEAIYPSEYYPYLKEFMSKVVEIQSNSLLVLKKK